MTCAELEVLLCEYVDGTLSPGEKTAVEGHIAGCASCAQLMKDVHGIAAFVETVPAPSVPAELVTRIMRQIPERRSWWSKLGEAGRAGLLNPRLALGLAMTILSFSLLARLGRVDTKELARADLDPVKMWQSLDDRTERLWDRTVQYYDNLPLVTDLQSRWADWNQPEQARTGETGNGQ